MNSQINFKAVRDNDIEGVKYGSLQYWKEFLEELIDQKRVDLAIQERICLDSRVNEKRHEIEKLYNEIKFIDDALNRHTKKYGDMK